MHLDSRKCKTRTLDVEIYLHVRMFTIYSEKLSVGQSHLPSCKRGERYVKIATEGNSFVKAEGNKCREYTIPNCSV